MDLQVFSIMSSILLAVPMVSAFITKNTKFLMITTSFVVTLIMSSYFLNFSA